MADFVGVPRTKALFVFSVIDLVRWLVTSVMWSQLHLFVGQESVTTFFRATSVTNLVFAIVWFVLLIPFARALKSTNTSRLARTTMWLAGVVAFTSAWQTLDVVPNLSLGQELWSSTAFRLGDYALNIAMLVCFWLSLTHLLTNVRAGLSAAFYSALGVGVLLFLLRESMPYEVYRETIIMRPIGLVLPWVQKVSYLATQVLPLILLWRVGQRAATVEIESVVTTAPDGQRDLLIGGLWLLGGLAVTVVSYSAASGGGRYVVTTGAIVYGVVRVVRGLSRLSASPTEPTSI